MADMQVYDTPYGRYLLNSDDNISKVLIKGEFWEPEIKAVVDEYLDKDVSNVIEVGSYIGDHTVYISQHANKVIAIEGNPTNYFTMCTNIVMNECWNVVPLNYVAGYGYVRLASEAFGDEWASDRNSNASGSRFIEANSSDLPKAYTVDHLCYSRLQYVSYLKTDCEGMDLDVLYGAIKMIKKFEPVITFEFNGLISPYPLEEYYSYLHWLGYSKIERIGEYNWLALKS